MFLRIGTRLVNVTNIVSIDLAHLSNILRPPEVLITTTGFEDPIAVKGTAARELRAWFGSMTTASNHIDETQLPLGEIDVIAFGPMGGLELSPAPGGDGGGL